MQVYEQKPACLLLDTNALLPEKTGSVLQDRGACADLKQALCMQSHTAPNDGGMQGRNAAACPIGQRLIVIKVAAAWQPTHMQ